MPGSTAAEGMGHPEARSDRMHDTLSIPYLALAASLAGLGIFLTTLWVTTFNWFLFPSILLIVVGSLMLFSPRAGANSA